MFYVTKNKEDFEQCWKQLKENGFSRSHDWPYTFNIIHHHKKNGIYPKIDLGGHRCRETYLESEYHYDDKNDEEVTWEKFLTELGIIHILPVDNWYIECKTLQELNLVEKICFARGIKWINGRVDESMTFIHPFLGIYFKNELCHSITPDWFIENKRVKCTIDQVIRTILMSRMTRYCEVTFSGNTVSIEGKTYVLQN